MPHKHGPRKQGAKRCSAVLRGAAPAGGGSCGQGHTGAAVGPWWEEAGFQGPLRVNPASTILGIMPRYNCLAVSAVLLNQLDPVCRYPAASAASRNATAPPQQTIKGEFTWLAEPVCYDLAYFGEIGPLAARTGSSQQSGWRLFPRYAVAANFVAFFIQRTHELVVERAFCFVNEVGRDVYEVVVDAVALGDRV